MFFLFLEPCYPTASLVSGTVYYKDLLLPMEMNITRVVDNRPDTCLEGLSKNTRRLQIIWEWNECGRANLANVSVSGENLMCGEPYMRAAYQDCEVGECTVYHACTWYDVTHDDVCNKTVCHYQCQAMPNCNTKTIIIQIDNVLHQSWTLCEVSFE